MTASFDLQRYFKEGWELFSGNVANFVVATIILAVVHFAANMIPLAGLIVSGPMMGGMYFIARDADNNIPFNALRIFDGFRLMFVPLILIGVLTLIFTVLGFIALILPGFLIMGWYIFAYLFAIEENLDFWSAMEASRAIGFENHLNVFLFALAIAILNFLGALALGIGLLVTVPLTICVITKAFDDLQSGAKSIKAGSPPPPPPPPPV